MADQVLQGTLPAEQLSTSFENLAAASTLLGIVEEAGTTIAAKGEQIETLAMALARKGS
jgi:hypothetical protein